MSDVNNQTREIKEIQEDIKQCLADFQVEHKKLEKEGKANSETLVKIQESFEKFSQEFQDTKTALDGEVKAREELELSMAKMVESNDAVKRDGGTPSDPAFKKSFDQYMRFRSGISQEDIDNEFKQLMADVNIKPEDSQFQQLKTLAVGSNPDGGFLVPVEMQSRIIKRVFETSPMRQIASVINISSEATEFVLDDGEFESGWVGEVDDRDDTENSKIGIITIPVNEQFAQPKATQKMLDDGAFNVESWISEKIAEKFGRTENTAFVIGQGIKQPRGFMDLPDWTTLGQYQRNALETRETETAGTIAADDLINVQTDLMEAYQANAIWAMRRKTWATIMKLKGTDNNYLLDPMLMFREGAELRVLGKRVILMSDMPADDTEGNVPIAYGDFREGYVILDRIGIRLLRDPYTTKGVVKFYTTKRTGGDVVNFQAIKRLKIKTT